MMSLPQIDADSPSLGAGVTALTGYEPPDERFAAPRSDDPVMSRGPVERMKSILGAQA